VGHLFPIISEYVQGNKVTVGAPFFNRVALPIGLFLLFLTGIGPLLAWRSASFKSVRRNFILPGAAIVTTAIVLIAVGLRPWNDQATFYSLVAFSLGAGVVTAISSEFLRGANVIRKHTGQNIFASMVQLTRRNTRRYGGYLVHFGVVVIFIGIAGGAFNQSHEQEMNNGQSMTIGPYKHRVRELHPGFEFELRHRVRPARRLSRQQEDHPAGSGEAFLRRFATTMNQGCQSLHAGLGFIRHLRREEPRQRLADHQGVS
jgi:cytochrome c biogenesis factor